MKRILFISFLFSATVAIAQKDPETRFAEMINPKTLKEKLTILASEEMEGRETGTEGQKKAAAYIEEQFKKAGLQPGNKDSYQQVFPVYRDEFSIKKLSVNGKQFEWETDFGFLSPNVNNGNWTYDNIVFAGYGIVDTANKINDYEGLDVKGKLVMIIDGVSKNYRDKFLPDSKLTSLVNTAGKIKAAEKNEIAGLLIVSKTGPLKKLNLGRGNMYFSKPDIKENFVANISYKVAAELLGRSFELTEDALEAAAKNSYTVEVKVVSEKEVINVESSNVIGIVPGEEKPNEYVFITGHYDHLGKHDDKIYYGADDDGSGSTGVMQLAEAFAAAAKKGSKPLRTMVFMCFSGEEKGLKGSLYYSEHPVFPLDKTSVDLNIDMVGRIDPNYKGDSTNYLYIIGDDKLSTQLTQITNTANKNFTSLQLDRKYNDPNDKNRFYYRSDHYNFASKGVPVIFYFNGTHKDYHQPTDTVDKINFPLMAKRLQLVYHTAWQIANMPRLLRRDIGMK